MRVLTESTQKKVDALYKDMDACSNFRNIVPQKYESQKDWPWYLETIFGDLVDKGHTPINECLQCKEDYEYIQLQYKDYDDFVHQEIKY